jgi:hypothetical protein
LAYALAGDITHGAAGTVHYRSRIPHHCPHRIADGIWSIHFCRVLLGRIDKRNYIIRTWEPPVSGGQRASFFSANI